MRAAKVTEAQESPGVVVPVCIALVADHTASVYLQLWNDEVDALHPSDIVRLQNGMFNVSRLKSPGPRGPPGLTQSRCIRSSTT